VILTELALYNFGVYRGQHAISLEPPSASKPVVLFGGMNGYGKTTILDAIQLALYGRLAQTAGRGNLPYEEYLRRSIHRAVAAHEGASVELAFTYTTEGKRRHIRVKRSWSGGKTSREHLEVESDGVEDPVLTEAWPEAVGELLPHRLAPFFFFDGEKIESLADVERSAEALATAVRSLLGLDLVDQLGADLVAFERRKKADKRTNGEASKVEAARHALADAEERLRLAGERPDHLRPLVDRARKRVVEADQKWQDAGGEAYERSQKLEEQKREVEVRRDHDAEKLLALAEGPAPLLAVPSLLASVAETSQVARSREARAAFHTELERRDAKVLDEARQAGADDGLLRRLVAILQADRETFRPDTQSPPYKLSEEAFADLVALRSHVLGETKEAAAYAVAGYDADLAELERIDRALGASPSEEQISELAEQRAEARRAFEGALADLRAAEANEEEIQRECIELRKDLGRLLDREVDSDFGAMEADRVLELSEAARNALPAFKKLLAERKATHLSELILDGYRRLLSKPSLVTGLSLDPTTLSIVLQGPDGEVPPERLSAGERQLFAVSVLWGLARASGRSMPVVIDTPLGRLDSRHRAALVERYFPVASHQVLLLSTDKEIDKGLLAGLKDYVGRCYLLRHDHKKGSAKVEEGYFFLR
jgi:DNA sulfur modification protein DndD